jgi:hypothetical protein
MSAVVRKEQVRKAPESPARPSLRAVAEKSTRPSIKVYTGTTALKEAIEKAAEDDRPGQGASAFLLRLFWKHQKAASAPIESV